MPATLSETNGGRTLEVQVRDKLIHSDYEQFVPAFERLVAEHGKIRVLFEMKAFHGWSAGALWDDIKFDIKHFADIERLAMVGDANWEHGMSVFCRPFTSAQIRFFESAAIQAARAWLAS
jgi:hypothetical protein